MEVEKVRHALQLKDAFTPTNKDFAIRRSICSSKEEKVVHQEFFAIFFKSL